MTATSNLPRPISQTPVQGGAMVQAETQRAIAKVQAQMILARQFPRDIDQVHARLMAACSRPSVASTATYSYPKGKKEDGSKNEVSGATIDIAKLIALNYGNIDHGIEELDRRDGESTVRTYAWDLETNTLETKTFTVKHERYTKSGGSYKVSDPREIYEIIANNGSRRQRNCILGVIPPYILEDCLARCVQTKKDALSKVPIEKRISMMVEKFAEFDVTPAMIEARVGKPLTAMTVNEMVEMQEAYTSIKKKITNVEEWFNMPEAEAKKRQAAERQATESIVSAVKSKANAAPNPDDWYPPEEPQNDGTFQNFKADSIGDSVGVRLPLSGFPARAAAVPLAPQPDPEPDFDAMVERIRQKGMASAAQATSVVGVSSQDNPLPPAS